VIDKQLVKGTIPMLVLGALARAEMDGYQLIKFIEQASNGALRFSEGALYPVLHTLERDGLLDAHWIAAASGRQRKYYRITDAGRAQLRARKGEWESFATAIDLVLDAKAPGADHA